ncbi:hypothetical protein TRFO_30818 [Tritrichomonas foetus]|uniref:Uncharacterized protein n=1 Tax=Tritrichomonas foetus TaxID=1144522 RepID=A0A1J4JUP2_9EUKA|nr:hypothetical protein TRFO_30818 [Tritrichomonas foetus]|eukprot:OHT02192.1 hypothetical protein TRFO_30818 [Tritrichomonas foetus]
MIGRRPARWRHITVLDPTTNSSQTFDLDWLGRLTSKLPRTPINRNLQIEIAKMKSHSNRDDGNKHNTKPIPNIPPSDIQNPIQRNLNTQKNSESTFQLSRDVLLNDQVKQLRHYLDISQQLKLYEEIKFASARTILQLKRKMMISKLSCTSGPSLIPPLVLNAMPAYPQNPNFNFINCQNPNFVGGPAGDPNVNGHTQAAPPLPEGDSLDLLNDSTSSPESGFTSFSNDQTINSNNVNDVVGPVDESCVDGNDIFYSNEEGDLHPKEIPLFADLDDDPYFTNCDLFFDYDSSMEDLDEDAIAGVFPEDLF